MRVVKLREIIRSLSARRAWIEIKRCRRSQRKRRVALRKESVDRNVGFRDLRYANVKSLSARRAWIEITIVVMISGRAVSLSARRAWIEMVKSAYTK